MSDNTTTTLTGFETAIIGMSGRYPGASNLEEFWDNLKNGRETISFFSDPELIEGGIDLESLQDPNYVKAYGILDHIEYFDSSFFGYSPADARQMDPQMRLFHEHTWAALEDAGYDPATYSGLIGLYVGAADNFYWRKISQVSESGISATFSWNTLANKDYTSTRISFKLNLTGPSSTIFNACSTSLIATHLACQSLLSGDCDIAVVGGVTASVLQYQGYQYQEGMLYSADGHTRSFDAKARGTIFGDAIGIVVLKRLQEAVSDGDHIYAVIKGTAINNDGNRKVGYTAPSVEGQAEVIRAALQIAEIESNSISFIEAHGTATALGDPIEIEALTQAFNTDKKGFCPIGSVKSNVGHLDATAGVTGLIKATLALKHKLIPPSLHFNSYNPEIDFENSPFYVNTRLMEWKNDTYPLRAGVSSFGIGGTNAHVILEEAPGAQGAGSGAQSTGRDYLLILLSAKTPSALDEMTANLARHFKTHPHIDCADAAYTLQVGRKAFSHRRIAVCSGIQEAESLLSLKDPEKLQTAAAPVKKPTVVFMFPGQGSQYVNMGLELYNTELVFRREMDRCFEILRPLMGYDIKDILYPTHPAPSGHLSQEGSRGGSPCPPGTAGQGDLPSPVIRHPLPDINQTEITQPVIFVLEYALAKLLIYWGIKPQSMMGHSIGEYTAACLSGVFSLEDALKLMAARGELMQQMPPGAMLSVSLPEEELKPLLNEHIELAAVNSPSLCVVSGILPDIEAFEIQLNSKGINNSRLHTSHAFHSRTMDPILNTFENKVRETRRHTPGIPYISNVTGTWITPEQVVDPGYWSAHLRRTVRFGDAVTQLIIENNIIFVEVGPGNVLSTLVRKHPHKKTRQPIINLIRHPREEVSDIAYLLQKVGQCWLYGQDIDWTAFYSGEKRNRVSLPTYPFEGKCFHINLGLYQNEELVVRRMPIADWFYIPSWIPAEIESEGTNDNQPGTRWLVFMDTVGLGGPLVNSIEKQKGTVFRVKYDHRFHKVSDSEYIINPGKSEDYDALFYHLNQTDAIPDNILHLWNVTGEKEEDLNDQDQWVENIQQLGFYSLTEIARSIGSLGITRKLRLIVVTDNMQRVTGKEALCPAKATILGPVKVIPKEYTNITCQSIDIFLPPPGNPGREDLVDQLMQEFKSESTEDILAYRNCQRWQQIYQPLRLNYSGDYNLWLRYKGVYLITGGFGGMGLEFAMHLVKIAKARLVMLGRSYFPPRKQWKKWLKGHEPDNPISINIKKILHLERVKGEVLVFSADVSDRQRMKEVICQVNKKFGPINGIIHTAGSADYAGVIQRRTREMSAEIFAPKVNGTLVLDHLLKENQLDFFILCSSISSILGPFGEVGYCAANAFLDAFAHSKASAGRQLTVSINWDAWQDVGMAAAAVQRGGDSKHKNDGLEALRANGILKEEGDEVVNRILENSFPQVVVSTTDFSMKLRQQVRLAEPLDAPGAFDSRGETVETDHASQFLEQRPDLTTTYAPPDSETEKILAQVCQEHLGIEKIGIYDNFFELGANSMDILQINNKLNQLFKKDIPLVAFYTYANISNLKTYLDGKGIEVQVSIPGEREQQRRQVTPTKKQEKMEVELTTDESKPKEVAVVGMAGRFPGANNVEEFWENLQKGVESIAFFSPAELEQEGAEAGLINHPGYVKAKGSIEGIEYFDALFFGYKPREIQAMDPQIRVFQECVWEALETAGYDPFSYSRPIGLYGGASESLYWRGKVIFSDTGLAESILSNKDVLCTQTSYKLNLQGPSISLQTMCSTSLLAVHLACRGLMDHQCDIAVAGGVSVVLPEKNGYFYQEGMLFSSDGHIRAFDGKASGTVFSSGAGVVALKRLQDAEADGDTIYAIIKGTSVNNDGERKVGFTAPSTKGQADVIRAALQDASVEPESIAYVETHGTGTSVGDPIELEALKLAFNTGKKQYCALGSVKTNIGHLDTASGVVSLIKAVQALINKKIPPSLHYENPNPRIDFENSPFYVNTQLKEWNHNGYPFRIGVSSFGFGGTNVCAVLEEWPRDGRQKTEDGRQGTNEREYQLILLSAKTETALDKITGNLAEHFKTNPGINLADAVYTLQVGRRVLPYRRMLLCLDVNEAIAALTSPQPAALSTYQLEKENPPVIFMFPGQGAQYVNIGLELYKKESIFREALDLCFEILKPLMDCDIKEILYPTRPAPSGHPSQEGSRGGSPYPPKDGAGTPEQVDLPSSVTRHPSPDINQTEITQPVIFAFEYALAILLIKWGIKPYAMIGHSIGEYVAACLSGVFSLEDALTLVVNRGKLMQEMPKGSMMGVVLPEEELKPLLTDNHDISIAAVNGPGFCTVSGPTEAIKTFEEILNQKEYETRPLHTSHAFHSRMMDPILKLFEEKVKEIQLNEPHIPFISNVTGTWATAGDVMNPGYWASHIRKTVRFSQGLETLSKNENAVFVEVGPGKVLTTFARQQLANDREKKNRIINLVKHPRETAQDDEYLLDKLGHLWLNGVNIDWNGFYGEEKRHRIALPTYPFEGHRYPIGKVIPENWEGKSALPRRQDINQWFYIPSWKRSPLPLHSINEKKISCRCLVFMDQCGLGSLLVERLRQEGAEVVEVQQGNQFVRLDHQVYTINPGDENHYEKLVEDLAAWEKIPRLILHLWTVTHKDTGESQRFEGIQKVQDIGFYSLLNLARALGSQEIEDKISMTVVSNDMQQVLDESLHSPGKATILGPVLVIPREYPGTRCSSIDITLPEPGKNQEQAMKNTVDWLLAEIKTEASPYPVTAYRSNMRWVRIYEPIRLEETGAKHPRLKEKGVYLITGGLGGIGYTLAQLLAQHYQARLVLTGRTDFPPRQDWDQWLETHNPEDNLSGKIRKVIELEKLGAEVLALSADVSDSQQMKKAVETAEEKFGPVNGVVHSAGLPDAGVIQARTRKTTEHVYASKINGTLILDTIFKDRILDFFFLCSSISSVNPPMGQVAYTAANAFLDAFSHYKNATNDTPVMSINWDSWQQVGMAVNAAKQWKGLNVSLEDAILPEEGKTVFLRVLGEALPQVVTSTRNLFQMMEAAQLETESAGELQIEEEASPLPKMQRPKLKNQYVEPTSDLEKSLTQMWQEVLAIDQVGIDDNFFDLGATSLDIIQVNNQLKKVMGKRIPLVTLYNYSTVGKLARHLSKKDTEPQVAPEEKNHLEAISKGKSKMKQRGKRMMGEDNA